MSKRSNPRANVSRVGHKEEVRTDYESRIGDLIEPQSDGCWHFTGRINADGYGVVWAGYDQVAAHRFVYRTLVNEIPDDYVLHHECQVKHCVNPAHLTLMTRGDHVSHHHDLRAAAEAA